MNETICIMTHCFCTAQQSQADMTLGILQFTMALVVRPDHFEFSLTQINFSLFLSLRQQMDAVVVTLEHAKSGGDLLAAEALVSCQWVPMSNQKVEVLKNEAMSVATDWFGLWNGLTRLWNGTIVMSTQMVVVSHPGVSHSTCEKGDRQYPQCR